MFLYFATLSINRRVDIETERNTKNDLVISDSSLLVKADEEE